MTGSTAVEVAGVNYGPTLSTSELAGLLSCSPELLQRKVGTGELPVEPLRLGNRLRWPTLPIAQALGLPAQVVVDDGCEP